MKACGCKIETVATMQESAKNILGNKKFLCAK